MTRSSTGATDDRGDAVPDTDEVATVCELQQERRQEKDQQGELSDTQWVAYFLPGEDLSTADALIVDGQEFELVGDPWQARSPRTQEVSHVEVTLRRTAGSEDAS